MKLPWFILIVAAAPAFCGLPIRGDGIDPTSHEGRRNLQRRSSPASHEAIPSQTRQFINNLHVNEPSDTKDEEHTDHKTDSKSDTFSDDGTDSGYDTHSDKEKILSTGTREGFEELWEKILEMLSKLGAKTANVDEEKKTGGKMKKRDVDQTSKVNQFLEAHDMEGLLRYLRRQRNAESPLQRYKKLLAANKTPPRMQMKIRESQETKELHQKNAGHERLKYCQEDWCGGHREQRNTGVVDSVHYK